MSFQDLHDRSSHWVRIFGPKLRRLLDESQQLDNFICHFCDKLYDTILADRPIQCYLSQLRSYITQSSEYHRNLQGFLSSVAQDLTEALNQTKPPIIFAIPVEIIRMIFSYLNASDAALFLCATGLSLRVHHDEIKPFLEYHRDLPLTWSNTIKSFASHGHKVLLVGRDAEDLHMRIHQPLKYWTLGRGNQRLSLLLLVRTSPQAAIRLHQEKKRNPHAGIRIDSHGSIEWVYDNRDPWPPIMLQLPTKFHHDFDIWKILDTDNRLRLVTSDKIAHHEWDRIPIVPQGHIIEMLPKFRKEDQSIPWIDVGLNQKGRSRLFESRPGCQICDPRAEGLLFLVNQLRVDSLGRWVSEDHGIYAEVQDED